MAFDTSIEFINPIEMSSGGYSVVADRVFNSSGLVFDFLLSLDSGKWLSENAAIFNANTVIVQDVLYSGIPYLSFPLSTFWGASLITIRALPVRAGDDAIEFFIGVPQRKIKIVAPPRVLRDMFPADQGINSMLEYLHKSLSGSPAEVTSGTSLATLLPF